MVAFDGSRTAAENAAEMREAVAAVATGEVTIASRDVRDERHPDPKGDWLGLADGEPVAGGSDFDDVTYAVVERLLERAAGAADAPRRPRTAPTSTRLLDRIAAAHPDLEVDVQEGGQPHYHLLLSAE